MDVLKVLIQHTPLLPNTGYLACLGLVKSSSVHVADLLDEFFVLGAGIIYSIIIYSYMHFLHRKTTQHKNDTFDRC
jgi:hypothetical protein